MTTPTLVCGEGFEIVPVRPSATLTAKLYYPTYYAWGCATSDHDDVYLVSSSHYNSINCNRLSKRVEVLRLNSTIASSPLDEVSTTQAYLYPESNCVGEPVRMETFYSACNYNLELTALGAWCAHTQPGAHTLYPSAHCVENAGW